MAFRSLLNTSFSFTLILGKGKKQQIFINSAFPVSYGKESSGGFSFMQAVVDDLRRPNYTDVLFHSTKAEQKILYALLDDLKKDNMKPKRKPQTPRP